MMLPIVYYKDIIILEYDFVGTHRYTKVHII